MSAGQFTDRETDGQELESESPGTPGQALSSSTPELAALPPGYRLRRGRNWFMLGLTYASYYLCRYNLSIVAPELKSVLGLSSFQYGAIQGARSIAYGAGQMINGLFTDRVGGKQAMTIGAVGTIILNILFGLTAWSNIGYLFLTLMLIRLADGYVQSFGSPGFIKINTAWFRRNERGGFAGVFGGMIQLGAIGVGALGSVLATGFAVPLIFFTLTVPKADWRYMFIIPPAIIAIIVLLMNTMVKNHPEEAGYHIQHDAGDEYNPNEKVRLWDVFRQITSNKIVWIVACAYFCTGFVRAGVTDWWVMYLKDVWAISRKDGGIFTLLVWTLPISAFIGSFGAGMISDKLLKGRRAPVAAVLYASQTIFMIAAVIMSRNSGMASAVLAAVLVIGINTGCNATHSILGFAAPMDLGGRKMAGFASGVIDSFQYYGQTVASLMLGKLLDVAAAQKAAHGIATQPVLAGVQRSDVFDSTVWFVCMLPWCVLGTILMVYLWLRYSRKNALGA
jgi:MFS transporter, OPA family, glycerol-3-phosphate transporter